MKQTPLLAALLCALVPVVHAETDIQLDEVVVTATRIEQPLKQTLSSTTVITQEDIKNSQAADVPTILRSVAGVEISQPGGAGKAASLYLRGSNATQVLVLLDGVRINSATLGTTSIGNLTLDQIERIEVVRGNVSSLYGSEAIGGVVQIFTKRGQGEPAFNISLGNGSHRTQRTAAGLTGSVANTEYSLQVSRFSTEGVSAINPVLQAKANPDNDGYDNSSVSANIRHIFSADQSLSASAFNSLGHNQYDSAYGLTTDINNSEAQVSKFSLVSDNRLSASWLSKLQLSQGTDYYQDFKNGLPVTSGSTYKTTNRQAGWQNTLHLDDDMQVLAGMEHLGQQIYTDKQPGYTQESRQINSLYAGYTGNHGAHQLQVNARQDNNSQYGTANTGLLGYGYSLSDAWRMTASYSTAFRAPSFNELYYPGYGNAALKPEQSRNTEAGLHYAQNEHNIDLVYFDNRTSDLINAVLVVPATYTYQAQNIDEARIDGIELSYTGQFGNTAAKFSAISQNPRNQATGVTLSRRAKQHGSLVLSQKLGALLLGAEWLYSDTRLDDSYTLASFNVINLSANYALNKQLKLALRADNLTDQNDSNAYGYNPLGRTFFASLNYQQ